MLAQRARDNNTAVLFCNLVGGQDELVFDGHSVAIDQDGDIIARGPQFEEAMVVCTIDPGAIFAKRLQDARHRAAVRRGGAGDSPTLARLEVPETGEEVGGPIAKLLDRDAELYAALVLGVRDYVEKNGFERVVVALSGGIDSALVAMVAVDALGSERVTLRWHAVPLLLGGHARRRAGDRGEPRRPVDRAADRPLDAGFRRDPGTGLQRH